jgi:uncharacterized protein YheU (UPF0270 family)
VEDEERFIAVDHRELSEGALNGLIEEFVSREGTDYGFQEKSFESKVRDVRRQLECGEARIVFDLVEETANIVRNR